MDPEETLSRFLIAARCYKATNSAKCYADAWHAANELLDCLRLGGFKPANYKTHATKLLAFSVRPKPPE